MKVVVCEDDKNLLELIELIISELNVEIVKCYNDSDLRKIIKAEKIDLLVIDYWLKDNKADTVIKEIRAEQPKLPIILMSAISELPALKRKLNVNDFVSKPFDIDAFKNKIIPYLS